MPEGEIATMPEVEEAFEEIEVDAPLVGIIMGSKNDKSRMQPAGEALHEAGIRYEVRVLSAHRTPDQVRDYCRNARMRGLKVIIAGAGMSAALPGVAAAHTDLPVVGVPVSGRNLGGLDAAAATGAEVLHAGTARTEGEFATAGGRVLNVTGLGPTPDAARERAYDAARRISFDGMQMRTDIAARAVERAAAG